MFQEYFGKFSLDSLASCAFGVNANSFKEKDSTFVKNAAQIFSQSLSFMLILFSRLIPGTAYLIIYPGQSPVLLLEHK